MSSGDTESRLARAIEVRDSARAQAESLIQDNMRLRSRVEPLELENAKLREENERLQGEFDKPGEGPMARAFARTLLNHEAVRLRARVAELERVGRFVVRMWSELGPGPAFEESIALTERTLAPAVAEAVRCEHDWEPNTDLSGWRCDKCGVAKPPSASEAAPCEHEQSTGWAGLALECSDCGAFLSTGAQVRDALAGIQDQLAASQATIFKAWTERDAATERAEKAEKERLGMKRIYDSLNVELRKLASGQPIAQIVELTKERDAEREQRVRLTSDLVNAERHLDAKEATKAQLYADLSKAQQQRDAAVAAWDGLSGRIFERIKHGDEKHQEWLRAELDAFLAGLKP